MKTTLKKASSLLIGMSALVSFHVAHAVIVYDNSSSYATGYTNANGSPNLHPVLNAKLEVGDEIILAGTARTLTNFTFQYDTIGFPTNGTHLAELRFYRNNGPLFNGSASPGTVLLDVQFDIFNISTNNTLAFDNGNTFGPNGLLVPDRFTWSLQIYGMSNTESGGPSLFDPVTVGANFPDYWLNSNGVWSLRQNPGGTPPINFAARAYATQAVPDSSGISTIALSVMGVLGFGLKGRNRR